MTCSIYCHQGRQPCQSPWNCGEGCHFNNATLPKQSAQDKAAAEFWRPDLPVQFVGPEPEEIQSGYPHSWLDYLPNLWDLMSWWQRVGFSIVLVALSWLVAAVVVPK